LFEFGVLVVAVEVATVLLLETPAPAVLAEALEVVMKFG
jgi:hypothetical protein